MNSVLPFTPTPYLGDLEFNNHAEFSFDDLPDEIYQSFFSSPTLPDVCNEFSDLEMTPICSSDLLLETCNPIESEPWFDWPTPLNISENIIEIVSPSSSVSTEPLTDPTCVYNILVNPVQSNPLSAYKQVTLACSDELDKVTQSSAASTLDFSHLKSQNKRRKLVHTTYIDKSNPLDDAINTDSSSSTASCMSFSSASSSKLPTFKNKKSSNREAAYRYRQKVKIRTDFMSGELSQSFKSMNRAKQSYEKALDSFALLQRVVQELTQSS